MDEKEIKKRLSSFFEKSLREDWMTDDDFSELLNGSLEAMGGFEKLSADIAVGVENGYSVSFQLDMLDSLIPDLRDWAQGKGGGETNEQNSNSTAA